MFEASMHVELLPEGAQNLVRSIRQPRQDLVLGYWREVLERPVNELSALAAESLTVLREISVPYLVIARGDLDPDYQKWR
jgi:hypothetical protein